MAGRLPLFSCRLIQLLRASFVSFLERTRLRERRPPSGAIQAQCCWNSSGLRTLKKNGHSMALLYNVVAVFEILSDWSLSCEARARR